MPKKNPQSPSDFRQATHKAIQSQGGEFTAEDISKQLGSQFMPEGDGNSIAQTLQSLVRKQELVALPSHRLDKRLGYAVCKIEGDPHG